MKSKIKWSEINKYKEYNNDDLQHLGKQALASRRLNQAIKNGTLKRFKYCEICGIECKTHGHHYKGYDYPFMVWWVCNDCNMKLKGKHNGELTLLEAREMIRNKFNKKFKKEEYYKEWLSKKYYPCSICGVPDKAENMIIYETDYFGYIKYICENCYYSK